ncbi:MAG TPA: hypothetical protein VF463_08445 [Sphingobium sp.]
MFKIISEQLVWWPVTFPGVTEDGEIVENRFEMRFRILQEDAHLEFLQKGAGEIALSEDGSAAAPAPSEKAASIISQIAVDWRQVAAENGEAIKFSDDHLRQLLNVPNTFRAILSAYGACRGGRAEARAGN